MRDAVNALRGTIERQSRLTGAVTKTGAQIRARPRSPRKQHSHRARPVVQQTQRASDAGTANA